MTAIAPGNEKLVAAHGLGVGDAAKTVVSAAEERGYSVAAIGPGQFRMIRQSRPLWAGIAAILFFPLLGLGLLFLLVKKVDEGSIAVFEERDGTKVRFVGSIDEEIATIFDGRQGTDSSNRGVAGQPQDVHSSQRDSRTPATATPVSTPPEMPYVPRAGRNRSDYESHGLIDSSPWGKRQANPAGDAEDDVGKTVARPRTAEKVPAGLCLRFPDGRSVPLATAVVVGRAPQAPDGKQGAIEVAFPDGAMSKTHLIVEKTGASIIVTDLHSTNGTAIDMAGAIRRCRPGESVAVPVNSTIHAGGSKIGIVEVA